MTEPGPPDGAQRVPLWQRIVDDPRWLPLLIVALPFLVFYWMTPWIGSKSLGNDYPLYSPNDHLSLMFSIKNGSFPLFVPGYWYGQTSSALTLGQIFHPVAWIASLLPGYSSGRLVDCFTAVKLCTLGLAQLALFGALRRMKFSPGVAFALSFVTTYNSRMLDLFRYGAGLESYTGGIFLCAALAYLYVEPKRRAAPFAVIAATYWTITGGLPQMAYYSMLAASLWILLLPLVARSLAEPLEAARHRAWGFYWRAGLYVAAGVLLAAAYALPFYFDFLRNNSARAEQSMRWSLAFVDTAKGILANWFLPLRADVHGAFGGSALILGATAAIAVGAARPKTRAISLLLAALMAPVVLFAAGNKTPVFELLWKYFPLFGAMRVPGRLLQIVPFLLLIGGMIALSNAPRGAETKGDRRAAIIALGVALAAYVVGPALSLWPRSALGRHSPLTLFAPPFAREAAAYGLGAVALLAAILARALPKASRPLIAALGAATTLQFAIIAPYATWTLPAASTRKPTFADMAKDIQERLLVRDSLGVGLEAAQVTEHTERRGADFDARIASAHRGYRVVASKDQAYVQLRALERRDVPPSVETPVVLFEDPGLAPAAPEPAGGEPYRVELTYSSYNRVLFSCDAPAAGGMLKLNYPFSEKWSAEVDGRPAKIYQANGAEMAVVMPGGRSTVELRYWSDAAGWGWILSCLCLALVGAAGVNALLPAGNKRWKLALLAPIAVSGGLYAAWRHSLYHGDDLKTRYVEDSSDPGAGWEMRALVFARSNMRVTKDWFRTVVTGGSDPAPPWVEYDIPLPAPGEYELSLSYASKKRAPMQLYVNGALVGSVAGEASGVHPKWFAEPLRMSFVAGENVVRLESQAVGQAPSLYKLRFRRLGPAAPAIVP